MLNIPKTIHYCWFGRNDKPPLVEKCIASWKKHCPDYEIKEWNEDNFDIHYNQYCTEAYNAKKWAFVSDYARFHILNQHGGIYLDTDVEMLKNIDYFLQYRMFAGFENDEGVNTGLILGSSAYTDLLNEVLEHYQQQHFLKENGTYDNTTVVERITTILVRHGLQLDGTRQNVAGMEVLPQNYFAPMDFITKKMNITENTYTIHHYAATWHSPYQKLALFVRRLIGENLFKKLIVCKNSVIRHRERQQ